MRGRQTTCETFAQPVETSVYYFEHHRYHQVELSITDQRRQMTKNESDIAADQHVGRHKIAASLVIDETLTIHRAKVPALRAGNRSFLYRFASTEPDEGVVNFGAVITSIDGQAPGFPATSVHLHFWADLASSYAMPGASFDIWYGSIIGSGRVDQVLPSTPQSNRIAIALTTEERSLLRAGILDWGGPARCTDTLAQEMGFESVANLFDEGYRLRESLKFNEPLSSADWRRAVVAAETCFTHPLGSRTDWQTTTGFTRESTKRLFAAIHQKLDPHLEQHQSRHG